jgi:hypothetical protein
MENLNAYIKEITRASKFGKLVFFIGAGLSKLSGYPTWSELVDKYYIEIHGKKKTTDYSSDDFLQVPQIYFDVKEENGYDNIIEKVFSVNVSPNPIHYKILALNPVHIITTNYDNLIEKTCWQRGKYYSHISAEEDVAEASSTRYLLKAHGDFSRGYKGKYVVLKESDYLDYERNYPLISNLMKTIMATNTILFIGYGLRDYNINLLLNWVKHLQKEGYNKPFFISTDPNPIEDSIKIYYEKKGLRIIDSTSLIETEKNDYLQRYSTVMDKLIESCDNDNLSTDDEIIDYIHHKLEPLFVLKCIRKLDLGIVFNHEYRFEINGTVRKIRNQGSDYLDKFFKLKEEGWKSTSDNSKEKFKAILDFFNHNNIICMENRVGAKGAEYTFSIDSLAYNNLYDDMETFIQEKSNSLERDYKKAFYLAYLGKLEDSYNLYSDIIAKAIEEANWWIHYLSQINRFRLYQSITNIKRIYGGGPGAVSTGHFLKAFSDEFVDRIESEMKNFDINDLFQSMPNEFQENYKILEFLSDNQFLYEDTVKLFELTNAIHAEINKGTYYIGGLSSTIQVQCRLNDNVRFLYENSLWSVAFNEIKEYIRNSLILQFEREQYDQTRDIDDFGKFFGANRSNFYIDYYDFVNITKSFSVEDVSTLGRSCQIQNFRFTDIDKIEKYICRIADILIKHCDSEKVTFLFHNRIIHEAKTTFYFAKYINLSDEALIKILNAILFHFSVSDADIGTKYLWCDRLVYKNGLPKNAIQLIEDFLIKQANNYKIVDFSELSSTQFSSKNFANLIHYSHKDYASEILSAYALRLTNEMTNQVSFVYTLSSILSDEAKKHLSGMREIRSIKELIDSYVIGEIENLSDYEDIVINFLTERLSAIEKDLAKGSHSVYRDNYVAVIAIGYFDGKFKSDKIKSFIGIDDEYDLFVDPEHFNYDKFKPVWLKRYYDVLLDKMSKNDHMKTNIVKILKERIESTNDKAYVNIFLKHFI